MKPSYLVALAVLLGLLASIGASRWLLGNSSSGAPVVVVATQLEPGHTITAKDLKVISLASGSAPAGAFDAIEKVVGRVARQLVHPGEIVMGTDLAAEGARGGLASTIEPGKRAITVRVNDVIAVAGFAFPGSYVDVLVSAKNPAGAAFSKIVLSRVKILAIAQETTSDPTKPKVVNAVTLELTPEEAEELDLARSVGTLSLVLRNELDKLPVNATGARLEGLLRGTGSLDNPGQADPTPAQVVPAPQPTPVPPAEPAGRRMIEIRGNQQIETIQGARRDRN